MKERMEIMNKPTVIFDSKGSSGNIYAILGMVSRAMQERRRYTAFNILRDRVFEAGNYGEALAIIGEEVELVDVAGVYDRTGSRTWL